MSAIAWWFIFLGFFLAVGGPEEIWFQVTLWGGIGMFVLALLSPLSPLRRKKAGGKQVAEDTYIYVSVFFLNRGNWYYYMTDDPMIRPNDVVVVPWGRRNTSELALVGWVEYRTALDVPYPLNQTKWILRKASDGCRPAFYETIRWPMEVNISWRWTRDERGIGFQAINDETERRKLRRWISENPELKPVERIVPGEKTENQKFWEAVRWYNIANEDW